MEERKDRRLVKVVALLLALGLAMVWGMVVGGGLVYAWMHFTGSQDAQARVRVIPAQGVLRGIEERLEERLALPEAVEERLAGVGAMVVDVLPRGPAEQAGLQAGDIIVAVDGQRFRFDTDLADLLADYESGDRIVLVVKRAAETERRVTVRLGEHPDQDGRAYLGIRYVPAGGFEEGGSTGPRFFLNDGSRTIEIPFGDFGFDLDDLPGEFEFHVVPDWDDSY